MFFENMHKKMFVVAAFTSLALGALGITSAQAKEQVELNFGIISTESSQNLRSYWEPFLADMEARTGYKIKPFFASDYAGVITGMQYNKVQLAWHGNKSAKEAIDRAQGEIFAKTIAVDGTEGYYSYLIAHKDSPINSIEDMFAAAKDMNFGNGDPNSTSGFLVPGYYVFAQNGKNAKTLFKRVLTASHETNALSVANKQVHVGTCETGTMNRLAKNNPEKHALLKIIWTSPLLPSDPLVWRKDLPAEVKATIRQFFMEYGKTDAEKKILTTLNFSKFKPSDNNQVLTIRQLELFKAKTELMLKADMDAAEKAEKIAAMDKQLAELEAQVKKLEAAKKQNKEQLQSSK